MAPLQSDSEHDFCSPHANNTNNATSTPPWHPSQLRQSESSMRSTLSGPSDLSSERLGSVPSLTPTKAQRKLPTPRSIQSFINPQNLVKEPPPALAAWTAINRSSPQELAARSALALLNVPRLQTVKYPKTPTDTTVFMKKYKGVILNFDIDMNEIEVKEELLENKTTSLRLDQDWQVDKEDGRMYHIGHQPGGAYSGTFFDDDPAKIPDIAEDKIRKMTDAWAKPARVARSKELFRLANEYIYYDHMLLLQRTSFVAEGDSVVCERPECERVLAANTYYLCLGAGTCFCVHCFEMLWNGECTGGIPDASRAPKSSNRRDSVVTYGISQLDGAFDRLHVQQQLGPNQSMHAHAEDSPVQSARFLGQPGLMQSDYASSDEELDPSTGPVCTPKRHLSFAEQDLGHDPGSSGSLGSTDSNGEWRYPPTYFQKIHASIQPGATLSEIDKAVLALWKHVSMEQWRWNGHLARSDARRAFAAGETADDESLKMAALTSDTTHEEVEVLVALTGLRKKDCQGRDLSVVLKEAEEMQKQK